MLDRPRREFRMCVDARSDSGATKRQFAHRISQLLEAADGKLRLTRIAAKLLAQANGRRILQMSSSDLHDRIKFPGFYGKCLVQLAERGDQRALDGFQRCHVHRGWYD